MAALVALLALACSAGALQPPELVSRAEALRTLGLPVAGYAAFRTGAALSVINQPRVPEIDAPVGCKFTRIGDAGRSCRAKIFYPAAAGATGEDAAYCADGRATSDGMAGLVGFRQLGLSFLLAHLADAPSGCVLDAPPAAGKFPLLVYSHGFGGNMDMGSYFLRTVASTGVVVAALEHTDGTASRTELADGSELLFSPRMLASGAQLQRRSDELAAGVGAVPGLAGLPKIAGTFVGGHSYGGPSALLAAEALGDDVDGLVLHDPALGMASRLKLTKPTVSWTSDEYDRAGVRCGATFHAKGAFHGNFVDAPLWAPPWVMRPLSSVIPAAGPADPVAVHAALARGAARFMRGEPASALITEPLFEPRGDLKTT